MSKTNIPINNGYQESNMIEMEELLGNFLFFSIFKIEKEMYIDGFSLIFQQKKPPFRRICIFRTSENFNIVSGLLADTGSIIEQYRVEDIKDLKRCRKELNLIIFGCDQLDELKKRYDNLFHT